MKEIFREFLGFGGGYLREPEGYLSWQHILFVSCLMATMVATAILLAHHFKHKEDKSKNKVLIGAAIAIDTLEITKIVIFCIRGNDPMGWLYELPLFLCSIQLITIPLAAFAKGRIKESALDFVMIFGILGAVLGTIGAGQNYGCYPVLSLDNVVSGLTHSISGFSSLYIMFVGLASMKRKNIGITFSILGFFCVAAYAANHILDYNYMFLMRGDGTPYDILYNLVSGSKIIYPLSVVALFVAYISVFYLVYYMKSKKHELSEATQQGDPHNAVV